jgi:hypothetical protein
MHHGMHHSLHPLQSQDSPLTGDTHVLGHRSVTPQHRLRRSSSGHGSLPPKIRRRNRLITSCLECRRRKLKCDKLHPCSNCTKFVRDCVFLAPALDPAAQLKLAEIKEKMGSLERTLEDDVARRGRSDSLNDSGGEQLPGLGDDSSAEDDAPEPDNERGLEPTPLAFTDAAYYEDADDDILDLGVSIGKMRLTERIGGFVRPKLPQEVRSCTSHSFEPILT